MKKIVISLLRRTDRKKNFHLNKLDNFEYIEAIDGKNMPDWVYRKCRARSGYKDPFLNRPLLEADVAVRLSHAKAWEKVIEEGKPCIVMEDDTVINDLWNEEYYEEVIKDYDFLYLQKNENNPEKVVKIDLNLEKPHYPYNMTSYVIKPESARILLSNIAYNDLIPIDEYLPELIQNNRLNAISLIQDSCNQMSRESWSGSDIEKDPKIYRPYKVHPIICGTDRKKCLPVTTSARHYGIDLINIGNNVEWLGTDMTGPGGGMKINLVKDFIRELPDEDVILFTDAYDVFYADDLDTILERYEDYRDNNNAKVVFSAEDQCWPDASLADRFPNTKTKYRFINSGTYIGEVGELKKIFEHDNLEHDGDDQLFFHYAYLEGDYSMFLDEECYIFQTHETAVGQLGKQLHNPITNCCPCIYHGNGGIEAKEKFLDLYYKFFPTQSALFIPHRGYEILDRDMLLVDFMTQDQCERLIDIADNNGAWGSLDYDKFPAQEIRMKELGLWEQLEEHWNTHIVPTVEQYWKPIQMYGLRDGFVMKYALDTQVSLNLHHHASLVTGSVKLNDDYTGAELIYPRQGITNKDIPVGKMLLFPGAVSHGHECLSLKSGIKYSLTIWSCRYPNDTI